jgi:hypothetical protein
MWQCKFKAPNDLFIRDLRPESNSPSSKANSIIVTMRPEPSAEPAAASEPSNTNAAVPTPDPPVQPPPNRTKIRSYRLTAGQSLTISNSAYTDFEIHSTGPISVSIGDCSSDFTFQIECHGEVADIQIKDERYPTRTGTNLVVVTAVEP